MTFELSKEQAVVFLTEQDSLRSMDTEGGSTISHCCGSVRIPEGQTLEQYVGVTDLPVYAKKITAQWRKHTPAVPNPNRTNCLVIPDEKGELLLEWDDV